jgi:hypothetical protein
VTPAPAASVPALMKTVTEVPDPAPVKEMTDAEWNTPQYGTLHGPIVPVPQEYWANFATDEKA